MEGSLNPPKLSLGSFKCIIPQPEHMKSCEMVAMVRRGSGSKPYLLYYQTCPTQHSLLVGLDHGIFPSLCKQKSILSLPGPGNTIGKEKLPFKIISSKPLLSEE